MVDLEKMVRLNQDFHRNPFEQCFEDHLDRIPGTARIKFKHKLMIKINVDMFICAKPIIKILYGACFLLDEFNKYIN